MTELTHRLHYLQTLTSHLITCIPVQLNGRSYVTVKIPSPSDIGYEKSNLSGWWFQSVYSKKQQIGLKTKL